MAKIIKDPVKEAAEIIDRYAVTRILIRQWFMNVLGYLLLEVFTTLIVIISNHILINVTKPITRFKCIRESEFQAFERKLNETVKEADKAGYEVDIKYQMAAVGTTLIYTAIVIGRGGTYEPIQDT